MTPFRLISFAIKTQQSNANDSPVKMSLINQKVKMYFNAQMFEPNEAQIGCRTAVNVNCKLQ